MVKAGFVGDDAPRAVFPSIVGHPLESWLVWVRKMHMLVTRLNPKEESKLSTVCEKVSDRCLAPTSGGEGCDNMTMILVQFKKGPRAVPSTSGHSSPDQPSESSGSKDTPEST